MHIGLSGTPSLHSEEEWALVKELGVTWIKTSYDGPCEQPEREAEIAPGRRDNLLRLVEKCAEADLHLVIDLRYSNPLHNAQRFQEALMANPQALTGDIVEATRVAWLTAMSIMGDWLREAVSLVGHWVKDWEIWGEWTCPIVTQAPYNAHDYTLQLMASYAPLKEADPDCRVWTGGGGVNALADWVKTLVNPSRVAEGVCVWAPEGVGDCFDVLNWHHYFQTATGGKDPLVERLVVERVVYKYERALSEAASLLAEHGKGQWQASTEWGIPIRPDADFTEDDLPLLQSDAYRNGVAPMRESESAEFYEECLRCFERHGMQVLCVHSLRDLAVDPVQRERQFWGDFCGLRGWDGEKWYKRPHWDVVQKWAWRARDSEIAAFSGLERVHG